MNFENFLEAALTQDFWISKQVFCFGGKTYSPLFFNFLWNRLDACSSLPFPKKSLSYEAIKTSYQPVLGQSVLGMANFYWLNEVPEPGKKDKFLEYLLDYQGPNIVAFYTIGDVKKSDHKKNLQIIDINSSITWREFNLILNFLANKLPAKKLAVANKIFNEQEMLDVDVACMLINYLELVSVSFIDNLPEYLSQIIGSRPILNQLSNFFFARQQTAFFSLWSELESKYSDMFWIAFWSDQAWRAFHVVECLNNKNFVRAKQLSYGLPFGFINKYWTGFNQDYLHSLYEDLYEIDCSIKKGSSFYSLDLFYLKHFDK